MNELFNKLKSIKGLGLIILLIAAGLLFVIISGFQSTNESSGEEEVKQFDFQEYEELLEKRLENKIDSIRGISNSKVILLLECSYQTVYLSETSGKIVIVENNGSDKAVVEKICAPVFRGVAVICSGADNPEYKKDIIDMLSSLLGLSTNKIWVGTG